MFFIRCRRGLSAIEMMLVVAIIGILIAIAVPAYQTLVQKVKLKTCMANMTTILNSTRMFYMENPKGSDFDGVSVDYLLKAGYLKTEPRCPSAVNLSKSEAFYSVLDKPGKKIDVSCVNILKQEDAHGPFSKLAQPGQQ